VARTPTTQQDGEQYLKDANDVVICLFNASSHMALGFFSFSPLKSFVVGASHKKKIG
jgi:hypothetical protein